VIARPLQGMARVRSGQAAAWPVSSGRSVRRGSAVKRDFACPFTRRFSPVLVVLRPQSCLRPEGRARTLSGPSPDLSPARSIAPSARRDRDPGHAWRRVRVRAVAAGDGVHGEPLPGAAQAAGWSKTRGGRAHRRGVRGGSPVRGRAEGRWQQSRRNGADSRPRGGWQVISTAGLPVLFPIGAAGAAGPERRQASASVRLFLLLLLPAARLALVLRPRARL
jgi:hypothetical protein